MIKILYVCLGNICRSPISEATMREMILAKGLSQKFFVDSAGTMDYHIGKLPDQRTQKNAEKNGIIITHRCRQLSIPDFSAFDYIVAMDQSNLDDINLLSLSAFGKLPPNENIFLLRKFDPENSDDLGVPDPYNGTSDDFENVFKIVQRSNEKLLDWLISKHL